jgi:pantoate--beta-alanine ligase
MASLSRKLRRDGQIVGLIPTMGALHDGHLSLIRKARQLCDVVIVSIFVNPSQFNEESDFEKYPKDLTSDAAILASLNVDYIFAPSPDEIYGPGYTTFVTVDELSDKLEGASRPGHFRGVATIVTILFNTVRPEFAFFGQKDAQQVSIIQRLTKDLGFETEVIVLPTIREEHGLAMSSRNERLTPDQRIAAAVIYKSLLNGQKAIEEGESNASRISEIVRSGIESEPLAVIDYVAVVDNGTLEPIERISESAVLIAVAVRFGEIRLIDNIILNENA